MSARTLDTDGASNSAAKRVPRRADARRLVGVLPFRDASPVGGISPMLPPHLPRWKGAAAAVLTCLALGFASPAPHASAAESASRIGAFVEELAPLGLWVDCRFGRCWIPPHVGAAWQPYSNGRWASTEFGWTWVSGEAFGSSPFHYGTWVRLDTRGWAWVPGTVWAPAWVVWSYGPEHVGWAPIPPNATFDQSGVVQVPVHPPASSFVYVPSNRFVFSEVATSRLPVSRNAAVHGTTRRATGLSIAAGILRDSALPMELLLRANGRPIETRSIESAGTSPEAPDDRNGRVAVVAPPAEVRTATDAARYGSARKPRPGTTGGGVSRDEPRSGAR